MSCDCDAPTLYRMNNVKVRKVHKCCECGNVIRPKEKAQKVDALYGDRFSSIYTCEDCSRLRDYIRKVYADEDHLCCHGELQEFLYNSDGLIWEEDDIEIEAADWLLSYDESKGVVRGQNHVIAAKVDWLKNVNGKWCYVGEAF